MVKPIWEILVPTIWHTADEKGNIDWDSEERPIKKKHHKVWDSFVRGLAGGLTIFTPTKGEWISKGGQLFSERMIPVRIMCEYTEIEEIAKFSLKHYRQRAICFYKISNEGYIYENTDSRRNI